MPLLSILTLNPAVSPRTSSHCASLLHLLILTLKLASLVALSLLSLYLIAVSAVVPLVKFWMAGLEIIKRRVGSVGKGEGSCGRNAMLSEVVERYWLL